MRATLTGGNRRAYAPSARDRGPSSCEPHRLVPRPTLPGPSLRSQRQAVFSDSNRVRDAPDKDHVDDAARASECADHFVSQISRNVGNRATRGMRRDNRRVEVLTMSQNVGSETCETSTIIPNRFISRTTFLPNSFSPRASNSHPTIRPNCADAPGR